MVDIKFDPKKKKKFADKMISEGTKEDFCRFEALIDYLANFNSLSG